MEALLETLAVEAWVRGSLIISNEGLVIMDKLRGDLDRDAVAALAYDLVTEVRMGLEEAQMEPFTRVVLSATAGELVVVGCGNVYLVVVAAAGSEAFYIEIDSAARRLHQLAPQMSMREL
jgi:predicted regulator of Ras-like GTPase activity (Roadblock/LC7/MglB family)